MSPQLGAGGDGKSPDSTAGRDASAGEGERDRERDRERELLRAAVTEAHDRALAASRAKSEFLATMSHEMRTPLNAVLGYVELLDLELPGALNPAQHQYLERIRGASSRLLKLISDVLDLAKLDAGRLVLTSERADAASAIAEAVRIAQPLATDRGVRIVVHHDGAEFIGDRRRVVQIIEQLISNAVRFSERGGGVSVEATRFQPVDANASSSAASGWCAIRIEDAGTGIDQGKLEAIFQPFTQLDSSLARAEDGSGLGLTIVRRLARLMGGDLSVTSRLGTGSAFTVWLPAPAVIEGEEGGVGTAHAMRERRGSARAARGLVDVADAMLSDLDALMERFVQRLQNDPHVGGVVARMDRHLVEDHFPSFIADIAQSLVVVEGAGGESEPMMRDSSDIQHLIADRHGAYRQRAGWTDQELEREYDLLLETIEEIVRTALPATAEFPPESIDTGLTLVRRFVERAREHALAGYRRAAIGVDADVDVAIPSNSGAAAGTPSTSTRLS